MTVPDHPVSLSRLRFAIVAMALIVLCSIWAIHYHTPCLADATSAAASQGPGALCVIDPVQSRAAQLRINLMASLMVVFSLWGMLRMVRRQQLALEILQRSQLENRQLIARLEAEHERSSRAASTDHLSGLYNRREFIAVGARALSDQRHRRRLLAVLFI